MLNSRVPTSLAEAEVTLSGVIHAQPAGATHLPLASALQLSLDVVRLVASTHDKGEVVGVLDAAHLVCRPSGALSFGGGSGNPIAPELKRGDKPDRLSDVYALGALMYRLLTGHRVESVKLVEPPSHFNPAVETALDELVLQALEEDPSERPYSARELETRLLEIFDELGLEPSSRVEASHLISSTVLAMPKKAEKAEKVEKIAKVARAEAVKPTRVVAAQPPPRPSWEPDVEDDELDDADDDVPARPQGKLAAFLYDLGWVKGERSHRKLVPLGGDDDEVVYSDEISKPRNKLSRFMYDLGWLQSIDWDSPKTLLYLKRGAIAFGVLLLIMVVWPSNKQPRLTAAQAALIAQTKKSVEESAPAAKKAVIVKPAPAATTKRASGRR